MIVLDTNVVSEIMRAVPDPGVSGWLRQHPPGTLRTTAVTVAEIRYGIARLPAGRRQTALLQAAGEIFAAFSEQVLPFDHAAAQAYADVVAGREKAGSPIDGFDAQIAAICRVNRAALATRNGKDFVDTGVTIVDPWETGA